MKHDAVVAVLMSMLAASCSCRPPQPAAGPRLSATQANIQELASGFPPEHEDQYHVVDLSPFGGPPDDSPQSRDAARVHVAYHRLERMGIVAFPDLVAASDDKRYSFSSVSAAWMNHSVGDACFMIIEFQVDYYGYGYKSRDGADGRHARKPQYLYYVRNGEGLKSWWEQHKTRSLPALQEEALRWTIEQEKSIGFVDEAQRREILGPLESRLERIR